MASLKHKITLKILDALLSLFRVPKNHSIPPPKKLLLCHGAHLGDVILTTALLPALKQAFPTLEIGIAVGSWSKCVVENHPLISHIHVIDHWKLNRAPLSFYKKYLQYRKTKKNALQEIKERGYDMAVDCNFHFPNFSPILYAAKIKTRVGFISAGFSPLLTHPKPWTFSQDSVVYSFYSLLDPLELGTQFLRTNLKTPPQKEKQNYIVIHMGAGHSQKKWPRDKWRALAKKLENTSLYFTGQGTEENLDIAYVIQDLKNATNLCDQLTFNDFVSLIQNAKLLIGVDTSAGHIASAVDTPSILLYTGIHPLKLWAPFTSNTQIISKKMPCSPCGKGCKSMTCIKEITVDDVYAAIR